MELPNRDAIESRFGYEIARLLGEQRSRVLKMLGSPPDFSRVSDSEWQRIEDETFMLLVLLLRPLFERSYSSLSLGLGLSVELVDARARAEDWARGQARELAGQLVTRTKELVQQDVEKINADLASLAGPVLYSAFGPDRAAGIAVTEVTRSMSHGEIAAADRFELETGRELIAIWRTAKDSKVCPVCYPLEGTRRQVWGDKFPLGPPAHPKTCRCFIEWQAV